MRVPLSWLRDYVDITLPAEQLAEILTRAGLEVGHIDYIGVPQTMVEGLRYPKSDHLVWDRERLLLGAVREVKPHPNADKLVLAMVEIGGGVIEQCVTGAPNLFPYKGTLLDQPVWTAFAAEGAEVWDGHSEERKRMILKEKPLRGIPNKSMVCSEKELGMSEEHEGIILFHDQPTGRDGTPFTAGTPLADVFGDVVFDVELTPNLARALSIYGVAREVAFLLGVPLRPPSFEARMDGESLLGAVSVEIRNAELNPRFTAALLRGTTVKPAPEWMQRRLSAVGSRPINNIVDVTNYITFEIGQPLHAFDYDKLVARNAGKPPTIITRTPDAGETLETLDHVKRTLEPHNILVSDTHGALALGGVIGGAETEISDSTTTVLLEAASWNFINIRQTMGSQNVRTDAGTRYSRGVHPSQALLGLKRGIELMRQAGGGQIARDIVDVYPHPVAPVTVDLPLREVERLLGVTLAADVAADYLRRAAFGVTVEGETLHIVVPDDRMDIGTGVVGQADVIEELARALGYDNIPDTIIEDAMPPQFSNRALEGEERARDVLASLGLREQISYRMTTPEREAQLTPPNALSSLSANPYVALLNPTSADKTVLRKSMLISLLENARNNVRFTDRQAAFEIGAVYFAQPDRPLPDEPRRLGILITGRRAPAGWIAADAANIDFFDLKGVIEGLLDGLHVRDARYERSEHTSLHPGRSARLLIEGQQVGDFGELHPLVAQTFELAGAPVMVAELDLEALLAAAPALYSVAPLPNTPPVLQDIALVVKADISAAAVEAVLIKAGGDLLRACRLFDVYTGDPIPEGYKSVAYNLVYQVNDRTLTDKEVASVHARIVKAAERELDAKLRA
ncbi:MAG: phenylalanine--tRNA ligase subunit beta [Chloroflexota bacterium]|nr:phenylalanine--tRNA ligase subunit beta [Chloroflexota bacterium]